MINNSLISIIPQFILLLPAQKNHSPDSQKFSTCAESVPWKAHSGRIGGEWVGGSIYSYLMQAAGHFVNSLARYTKKLLKYFQFVYI